MMHLVIYAANHTDLSFACLDGVSRGSEATSLLISSGGWELLFSW